MKVKAFLIITLSITLLLSYRKIAFAGCTWVDYWTVCEGSFAIGCYVHMTTMSTEVYYVATDTGSYCSDGHMQLAINEWACNEGEKPPGCSSSSGSCFTGDTKITTPDGEKEIKDIKEGDVVKSFDPDTGEITESTVTNPYSKASDHIYTITTSDGNVVKTTAEHPFYVGSESDQLPISTSLKIKSFLTRMKIYWVSGIHVLKTSL